MNKNSNFQLKMLSKENSLTPRKELVNGGKYNSAEITGLVESKFSIEKTAVETDWQEQKFILMTNIVELFKVVLKMGNGMMSNAQSHSMVKRSDSLLHKILS